MSEETWGYSNPVGEWIAILAVPTHLLGESLASLRHVLQLVAPVVGPTHRLRKALISWGEVDASGAEIAFHELEELEDVQWETLESIVGKKVSSEHRVIVSALFLEMDTQVAASGADQSDFWAEESAELQISFAAPEVSAAAATVMYSTRDRRMASHYPCGRYVSLEPAMVGGESAEVGSLATRAVRSF